MSVTTIVPADFTQIFPHFLRQTELTEHLLAFARRQSFPADMRIYWEGDICQGIAFLLSGAIRVYKCGECSREITLYEVGPGETCILNASCILGNKPYPANAVTICAGEMVFVPAQEFSHLLGLHAAMRNFVFSLLSDRLGDVMELVNEVAFRRVDERMLEYLLEKSGNCLLTTTHQKIANDLGTSREVVSRLLKDFERQGRVQLGRNEIRLTDDFECGTTVARSCLCK